MGFDPGAVLEPLDTRTADEVVADTLAVFQARRPDWVPRNAAPEVIYLEAVSQAVAEVLALGDTVIGGLAEALLSGIYGIPRLAGAQAVGTATITFDSTVSLTIPNGTRMLMVDYGVELTTTADTVVSSATSATMQVATVDATTTVNGVDDATIDLLSSIPNALEVTLASAMAGGAAEEGSEEYITRSSQRLARLTNSLVVPAHYSSYVLESGLASNATTIPAWDGTGLTPSPGAGTDGGEVTVVCYGFGGQVAGANRTILAADMQELTAAGVTVHVNEATLVEVDVTASVGAETGWDVAVVQANVVAALTAYLNPQTWPFGETVRETAVSAAILAVDGVAYVDPLTAPSGDTALASDEVATVGTLTVSVT